MAATDILLLAQRWAHFGELHACGEQLLQAVKAVGEALHVSELDASKMITLG